MPNIRHVLKIMLCIGAVLFLTGPVFARPLTVLFFYPTTKDNTYWPGVCAVLQAVAEDLEMTLIPQAFNVEDRFAKATAGVDILKSAGQVDGAIFSVAFGQALPLLQTANALNIPSFIQGPLFPHELPELGGAPRKKYPNWIGVFSQDELDKGYQLGKTLLHAAHEQHATAADGRVHLVGIGGDHTWYGSQLRQDGLLKAVAEDSQVVLHQVIPTRWTIAESRRVTRSLLRRYVSVNVVWAASDQLALGAAEMLAQNGRTLGENGFVGGLDLSRAGLKAVAAGNLSATSASLLVSYGEILLYLYDYLHGIDFAEEVGTEILFKTYTATQENAAFYQALLSNFDQVDFRRFSKALNPNLQRYDFSNRYIEAIRARSVPPLSPEVHQ